MAEFVPEDSKEYLHKVLWQAFTSLDIFTKLFIITSVMVITVLAFATDLSFDTRQKASGTPPNGVYDLQSYYPNMDLYKSNYLEGKNYKQPQTSNRAVLWFEPQDQWSFKLYNSAPEDVISRCNYDLLSWWDDGFLRYAKTHNECPGQTPSEIVYDPPIIFIPKIWNSSTPWSINSSSSAKYYLNNSSNPSCVGVINYKGEIVGLEQIAPGEQGVHWRTTQATTWSSGNVPGSCAAGFTTNWQEDYWLTDKLPYGSSIAKGLKRSMGGNKDITTENWDVWFDYWAKFPSPSGTITPTNFQTPSPKPTATLTPTPVSSLNFLQNSGFENTGTNWLSPWQLKVRTSAIASITKDTTTKSSGSASARVNISVASTDWYVQVLQGNFPITANTTNNISFWAKASSNRNIRAAIQGNAAPYPVYMQQTKSITTSWQKYTFSFIPSATSAVSNINFNLGSNSGQVWIDDVSVSR